MSEEGESNRTENVSQEQPEGWSHNWGGLSLTKLGHAHQELQLWAMSALRSLSSGNADVTCAVRCTSMKFSSEVRLERVVWQPWTPSGIGSLCAWWQGNARRERREKNLGLSPRTRSHSKGSGRRESKEKPKSGLQEQGRPAEPGLRGSAEGPVSQTRKSCIQRAIGSAQRCWSSFSMMRRNVNLCLI